jgi:hypothetical protein
MKALIDVGVADSFATNPAAQQRLQAGLSNSMLQALIDVGVADSFAANPAAQQRLQAGLSSSMNVALSDVGVADAFAANPAAQQLQRERPELTERGALIRAALGPEEVHEPRNEWPDGILQTMAKTMADAIQQAPARQTMAKTMADAIQQAPAPSGRGLSDISAVLYAAAHPTARISLPPPTRPPQGLAVPPPLPAPPTPLGVPPPPPQVPPLGAALARLAPPLPAPPTPLGVPPPPPQAPPNSYGAYKAPGTGKSRLRLPK